MERFPIEAWLGNQGPANQANDANPRTGHLTHHPPAPQVSASSGLMETDHKEKP